MKKQLASLLLIIGCFMQPHTGYTQGFLRATESQIVNEAGTPVLLRGIGLGGFMLQEGYMLHTAGFAGTQYQLMDKIEELVGEDGKNAFYDAWLANHCTKADIDSLAAWGFNSVRLPMHYKWYTLPIEEEPVVGQQTWLTKGFELTDSLVAWCKANQMYLILDLHGAPGGQGRNANISDYDPSKPSLWESEENKNKTIELWKKLAERYANEPTIGGYDLINETNWTFDSDTGNGCDGTNQPLWDLLEDITLAIREVDTNHIVMIGGNCWGNNYTGLNSDWDDNMVMSFHKYWNANDQGSVQGMIDLAKQHQMPLWLGESGENSNTWFTDAIKLVESNGIGWAWWPLKKLGNNNPIRVQKTEGWQQLINYWEGNAPKPSAETAMQYLMEFATAHNIQNATVARDVVDAMIRQVQSNETIPFRLHRAGNKIFCAEYDLGAYEYAYWDTEVANTGGSPSGGWNQGGIFRNDGVDIEECLDDLASNGFNVGWTEAGEWMKYTVDVPEAGFYKLDIRAASAVSGSELMLEANEQPITPVLNIGSTGGWQTWATFTSNDIYLNKGANAITLRVIEGGCNLNYFELHDFSANPIEEEMLALAAKITENGVVELFLNQTVSGDISASLTDFKLTNNGQSLVFDKIEIGQNGQSILLYLPDNHGIVYGDDLTLQYAGSDISSDFGQKLADFEDIAFFFDYPNPYNAFFPGKLEAEDFTTNIGFGFETTSDDGGGQNAGWADVNDKLIYRVLVRDNGIYAATYRLAAAGSDTKSFSMAFVDSAGASLGEHTVSFTGTGGWQQWADVVVEDIALPKGEYTLRLTAQSAGFNFNWMEYAYKEPLITAQEDGFSAERVFTVSPNPSNDGRIMLSFNYPEKKQSLTIIDLAGNIVYKQSLHPNTQQTVISTRLKLGLYLVKWQGTKSAAVQKLIIR